MHKNFNLVSKFNFSNLHYNSLTKTGKNVFLHKQTLVSIISVPIVWKRYCENLQDCTRSECWNEADWFILSMLSGNLLSDPLSSSGCLKLTWFLLFDSLLYHLKCKVFSHVGFSLHSTNFYSFLQTQIGMYGDWYPNDGC